MGIATIFSFLLVLVCLPPQVHASSRTTNGYYDVPVIEEQEATCFETEPAAKHPLPETICITAVESDAKWVNATRNGHPCSFAIKYPHSNCFGIQQESGNFGRIPGYILKCLGEQLYVCGDKDNKFNATFQNPMDTSDKSFFTAPNYYNNNNNSEQDNNNNNGVRYGWKSHCMLLVGVVIFLRCGWLNFYGGAYFDNGQKFAAVPQQHLQDIELQQKPVSSFWNDNTGCRSSAPPNSTVAAMGHAVMMVPTNSDAPTPTFTPPPPTTTTTTTPVAVVATATGPPPPTTTTTTTPVAVVATATGQ